MPLRPCKQRLVRAVRLHPSLVATKGPQRSPGGQLGSVAPILTNPSPNPLRTPTPVRESQGNPSLLAPSVPCVRPQFVGTLHQSDAVPAQAGVAPHMSGVCCTLPFATGGCPAIAFNGVVNSHHSATTAFVGTTVATSTTYTPLSHSQYHDGLAAMHDHFTT